MPQVRPRRRLEAANARTAVVHAKARRRGDDHRLAAGRSSRGAGQRRPSPLPRCRPDSRAAVDRAVGPRQHGPGHLSRAPPGRAATSTSTSMPRRRSRSRPGRPARSLPSSTTGSTSAIRTSPRAPGRTPVRAATARRPTASTTTRTATSTTSTAGTSATTTTPSTTSTMTTTAPMSPGPSPRRSTGSGVVGVAPGVSLMALKFLSDNDRIAASTRWRSRRSTTPHRSGSGSPMPRGAASGRRPMRPSCTTRSGTRDALRRRCRQRLVGQRPGAVDDPAGVVRPAEHHLGRRRRQRGRAGVVLELRPDERRHRRARRGHPEYAARRTDGFPTPGWAWLSGTSMATPHVSGVAALVASVWPTLADDPAALRARILGSGKPSPATVGLTATGRIVDAWRALDATPPACSRHRTRSPSSPGSRCRRRAPRCGSAGRPAPTTGRASAPTGSSSAPGSAAGRRRWPRRRDGSPTGR